MSKLIVYLGVGLFALSFLLALVPPDLALQERIGLAATAGFGLPLLTLLATRIKLRGAEESSPIRRHGPIIAVAATGAAIAAIIYFGFGRTPFDGQKLSAVKVMTTPMI